MNLKKHKKFITIVVLIIVGSFFVFTKLWMARKNVVLTVGIFSGSWNTPSENTYKILNDAILKFEKSHPGVKIKYSSGILKEDFSEWLSQKILLGKEPDVFMVLPDDFNVFSSTGALKNLDKLIKKDKYFNSSKYYKAAYESGKYHKSQFALPYESVPTLMLVNKTLLDKEGIPVPNNNWTWNDFYNICERVTKDTDRDGVIDQFGFYDYTWQDAVYSNGIKLFNDAGTESYFGDEKVDQAVNFVKKLNSLDNGYQVTSQIFDKGKVAFRPLSFSEYRTYKPYPWSIKRYSNFEWDCIKLPSGPNGKSVSQLNTLLMGISSRTKHEKLSWEFLKSLTYDEETQRNVFKYSEGISPIKSVIESPKNIAEINKSMPSESSLNMKILDNIMESAAVTPKFKKYNSVMIKADNDINNIINGKEDLDTALLILQREINNMLTN
ncbi:ABC transporter substrate-binding protein [Clostridium guangxiense]|uniref:ABC transporter substrate-binding protein n=1 Tax=Clostridium guangxiense TaxID=1662055 RepID=UPI001E48CB36|nr:sugar ABC transporter substrate-binding protein [Clostridium guangxiense]MCD2347060.1 sugar ABC transporter substrate-binding protein [Clostridium guangxiense]